MQVSIKKHKLEILKYLKLRYSTSVNVLKLPYTTDLLQVQYWIVSDY